MKFDPKMHFGQIKAENQNKDGMHIEWAKPDLNKASRLYTVL